MCDGDRRAEFGRKVVSDLDNATAVHLPDGVDVNEAYLSHGTTGSRRRRDLMGKRLDVLIERLREDVEYTCDATARPRGRRVSGAVRTLLLRAQSNGRRWPGGARRYLIRSTDCIRNGHKVDRRGDRASSCSVLARGSVRHSSTVTWIVAGQARR